MKRRGFTLTELLVVIGILVLLISMLLPTLGRAREMAKQTACLSQLRQLSVATIALLADNEGQFPKPAEEGNELPEDWIWWQPHRRTPPPNDKLQGRLVKYLGGDAEAVLRCPSDALDEHPAYSYSYSINEDMARGGNRTPIHLNRIKKPAEKIMFIEEIASEIDDGCWVPPPTPPAPADMKYPLSPRHDRRREALTPENPGSGNVVFADGSAQTIPRQQSVQASHWDAEKE